MQIKRAAFVLTERAGKEGKPEPAPGTDSSLYLVDPEHEFIVIYEDKSTVEEVRLESCAWSKFARIGLLILPAPRLSQSHTRRNL